MQQFNRPPTDPSTLRQLQSLMAPEYDAGNEDFQILARMVKGTLSARFLTVSLQTLENWLSTAAATNSADTEHGRMVRLAGPLLRQASPDFAV